MSLSLSSYTNSTYTEKMDSLLPRVSRDSKASVSPLALESGHTIKAKEWRRLTAIDYLSKLVTAIPDRNKPLPHRPISVVGSVHSHVSVGDVVVDVGVGPPPPLALAMISEEDLEGGGGVLSACEVDGPTARQCTDEDDGKQAHTEKDPLPVTHASSNHRRSMTLPLQAMPHLNLALGLSSSSSPSLGPSKAGEVSLQAEKHEQVISKSEQASGEANTTTENPPELRPASDIPHITALAELAASIVGEHPDAPPILDRVASLTLASPSPSSSPYSLPLLGDTSAFSLDPDSLSPLGAPLHTPLQNYIPNNHPASKFAWAGNTHRTTFGLITRANVPPTPPRLAMFVGGDGGDVSFRSNAGSVVGGKGTTGQKQKKSLGADTGIVLVQTSLDLGRGVGVRGSANGNATANANGNGNANVNANGNSNAAESRNGNPLANTNAIPLADANPNAALNPNATSISNANANSTVLGPELVEKEKEAVSELQVQVNESGSEGQVGKGGQLEGEGQMRKEGQAEKEDQMGKEGRGQVATGEVVGKTATGGAIGKTSTPAQPGTTTTTGKPSAPTQTPQPPAPARPSASVQNGSRLSTPVQSARLAVPLRPTRGKENRYLAGEQPRSVRRPPSQLRNVLCAI